jgi:hypothetical protein
VAWTVEMRRSGSAEPHLLVDSTAYAWDFLELAPNKRFVSNARGTKSCALLLEATPSDDPEPVVLRDRRLDQCRRVTPSLQ